MSKHTFSHLQALLFDMDGTLTLSRAASERCWRKWASRHDLDPRKVLDVCHGRQAKETVGLLMPHLDAEKEAKWLLEQELQDPDVEAVAGAAEFLRKIPQGRWALVTSAAEPLARYRLKLAGLPLPELMICADDVGAGKPDPEGYLLAAKKLKAAPEHSLVFEDTRVGIEAAARGGMQSMGIDASGAGGPKGADWVIQSYAGLQVMAGPPMQVRVS
jgi:sugar-phosphatase